MKFNLIWLWMFAAWNVAFSQTEYPTLSTLFLDDYLAPVAISDHAEVSLIEGLNSKHQDYSAIPYREGIVFTSDRGIEKKRGLFSFNQKNYSDLFYARQLEGGQFGPAIPLLGKVNGKYHDSAPTFDAEQTHMIFTRTSQKGKNWMGHRDLKLYEALATEDGNWSHIQALPYASDEYTTCHPSLSANGQFLIFASNRPGGYGGMDLYIMTKLNDEWQFPINLGPSVNSQGNEIFPHLTQEGELYYSSDGHFGEGGLDIFLAIQTDASRLDAWALVKNLGKPFNSDRDDFGFTIGKENMSGYLSSNRRGGVGKDDLYQWKMDASKVVSQQPNFTVLDERSSATVAHAKVTLVEMPQASSLSTRQSVASFSLSASESALLDLVGNTYTYQTNDQGQFRHFLREQKDYVLIVKKNGYKQHIRYLNLKEARNANNVSLTPIFGGSQAKKDLGNIEISPEVIERLSKVPTQVKTYLENSASRAAQPQETITPPAVGPLEKPDPKAKPQRKKER